MAYLATQFARMDARFAEIEARFVVDVRLTRLEERLSRIEAHHERMEERQGSIEERLTRAASSRAAFRDDQHRVDEGSDRAELFRRIAEIARGAR